MGEVIELKIKGEQRMDELDFNIFDRATCQIMEMDPDEFKRIQDKFIRHAEKLDWHNKPLGD